MPKPTRKANQLHQIILSYFVSNKPKTLANNVSDFNVERAAKRWAA